MLNCLCAIRIGLGWANYVFKLACHMFMHTYLYFVTFLYTVVLVLFLLSHSLFLALVYSMAPKRKSTPSQNPLRSGASSSSDPTPFHVWFRDDKAQKDFLQNFWDEAFIQNTTSFCQTFPTLTYPLSFTVGIGSHFVTSRSLLPPWSYRSFTPICTELILLYLISSLAFEVCTS